MRTGGCPIRAASSRPATARSRIATASMCSSIRAPTAPSSTAAGWPRRTGWPMATRSRIGDFEVAVKLEARRRRRGRRRPLGSAGAAGAPGRSHRDRARGAGRRRRRPAPSPPSCTAPGSTARRYAATRRPTLAAAGALLRRLVGAVRAMDEDRMRARGEIGAPPAPASGGGNPIAARTFARAGVGACCCPRRSRGWCPVPARSTMSRRRSNCTGGRCCRRCRPRSGGRSRRWPRRDPRPRARAGAARPPAPGRRRGGLVAGV